MTINVECKSKDGKEYDETPTKRVLYKATGRTSGREYIGFFVLDLENFIVLCGGSQTHLRNIKANSLHNFERITKSVAVTFSNG